MNSLKILFPCQVRNDALRLSVVSKLALIASKSTKELVETSRYFNSSADKRKAYDPSFPSGAVSLVKQLKQELIDGVLASLEAAGKALDGKDSNVTALKKPESLLRNGLDDMLMPGKSTSSL